MRTTCPGAGSGVWIGADPGGQGAFGVAVIRQGVAPVTDVVSCARGALAFVEDEVGEAQIAGVGIDAPLWWSSGAAGLRGADRWLRIERGVSHSTAQSPNSLRGAVLLQGVMFAADLRAQYGLVPLTETHPKALFKATRARSWRQLARTLSLDLPERWRSHHERDALLSALAAREGIRGSWVRDLSCELLDGEQTPEQRWLAPVHYYWPD